MSPEQDYGIETVRELIYSNPEIFQRFKPDLEQKYQAGFDDGKRIGFDDGKRQTARDFYLSGVSAEQIHKATGLRPHDYLDPI
jgi:hypothetical protein